MSAVTDFPRDAATSRFVDVCPRCGYSLVGSPDEGKCPECGVHYDQQVMILVCDRITQAGRRRRYAKGTQA